MRIRVDNDPSLKSALMRTALRLLGVKLQIVQIACPWMSGRIERSFGAFKAAITRIIVDGADLPHRLVEFRAFYNHVRTHQHLGGRTPTEAWSGIAKQHGRDGELVNLWHGELVGWYFPKSEWLTDAEHENERHRQDGATRPLQARSAESRM